MPFTVRRPVSDPRRPFLIVSPNFSTDEGSPTMQKSMASPRALNASTTRTVPSTEGPSSSDVTRSAIEPGCEGCAPTKRSAAVTNAAMDVFMSAAPRPYRFPSRIVGTKGSECHFSSGPGGTTSVWPARATTGRAVPWRIHRFTTSLQRNTSAWKPSGSSRSMIICWQPESSGVMDLRRIRAWASSSVSFFKEGPAGKRSAGSGLAGGLMGAARDGRAHALLDVAAHRRTAAEEEEHLGAHEERPDGEPHDVVEE